MFSNDIVPIFNSFTFQTNLVGPRKNFPIRSIRFHINEFTPLATYNLPLCVMTWGSTNVTRDGCIGGISTNTKEKATRPQLNSINT